MVKNGVMGLHIQGCRIWDASRNVVGIAGILIVNLMISLLKYKKARDNIDTLMDFYFTMIMKCHLLRCIGSTDSIIWLADTMTSTGCRCQTSHLMYADTRIVRIWQNRE